MKYKLIACLVGLALSPIGFAGAPDVNIVSPTGTGAPIYVTFPHVQPVVISVEHTDAAGLNNVTSFDVLVDDTSIIGGAANPFGPSGCTSEFTSRPAVTSCTTSSSTAGTVAVNWTITQPGEYALVVRAAHGGAADTDTETLAYALQLVSVEYPAPPAVANAFINAHYPKLTGGKRGCIISQIANAHAQANKYGPKGGPYNASVIHDDVAELQLTCK